MTPRWRLAAAGAALTARAVPTARVLSGPVWCPIHRLTGRSCPTCGLTRSVVLTAHGDLRRAVGFHLFGPAALAGLVALAAGADPADRHRPPRIVVVGVATAWVLYVAATRFRTSGVPRSSGRRPTP